MRTTSKTITLQVRRPSPDRRGKRGAALVLALSLLAIFSILGTCYVKYMNLSLDEADFEVRRVRAEQLAAAGVAYAAEGLRMEMLFPDKGVQRGVTSEDIDFDSYLGITQGEEGILSEAMPAPRLAIANVTIYDESARLNINHAAPDALQKVLGIDANTAREISARKDAYLAVDELVTRGPLNREQFDLLIPSLLTTYSIVDQTNPSRYLNVNEADPAVLGAVLNLSTDQAAQVKAKKPFASLSALSDAITSVTGAPATGVIENPALALKSRCFRVVCESRYAVKLDEQAHAEAPEAEKSHYLRDGARGRVEAVLFFDDDGSYRVLQWNTRGESIEADPA